jgi:hypothetical protein
MNEIDNIFKHTDSFFFTTNNLKHPAPDPESWWYYGFDHGQHI